jgi:hypothetical protein
MSYIYNQGQPHGKSPTNFTLCVYPVITAILDFRSTPQKIHRKTPVQFGTIGEVSRTFPMNISSEKLRNWLSPVCVNSN